MNERALDRSIASLTQPPTVVTIPQSVYTSFEGKYFLGQSPLLNFGYDGNAWGALVNPPHSGVDLYFNTYTVTNTSQYPFKARLWLNSTPVGPGSIADQVTPANLTLCPPPMPRTVLIRGICDWFAYRRNSCIYPDGFSLFDFGQ